jgi:anoctamin-10
VYIPFGEEVMLAVQGWLFSETGGSVVNTRNVTTTAGAESGDKDNATITNTSTTTPAITLWETNKSHARQRLNPGRLRDQMFAFTVTNQVVGTFLEVGLPFVLRFVHSCRERYFPSRRGGSHSKLGSGSGNGSSSSDNGSNTSTPTNSSTNILISPRKKRVVFEDEQEKGGMAERVFLERVREEAALPEYLLFGDFSEMVTQFGYVVLWSTIWPLAGGGSLFLSFPLSFILNHVKPPSNGPT